MTREDARTYGGGHLRTFFSDNTCNCGKNFPSIKGNIYKLEALYKALDDGSSRGGIKHPPHNYTDEWTGYPSLCLSFPSPPLLLYVLVLDAPFPL